MPVSQLKLDHLPPHRVALLRGCMPNISEMSSWRCLGLRIPKTPSSEIILYEVSRAESESKGLLDFVVRLMARRKRVTIAEATLSGAPLQCWDNSTRGLDSANAVQFCKTLRTSSEFFKTTSVVAIYQAPQSAYDQFDKVRSDLSRHQVHH